MEKESESLEKKQNKSLFQIQDEYLEIYSELEESYGETSPELEERLKIKQAELQVKAKSYTGLIKQIEGDIWTLTREKDRIEKLLERKEKDVERLKANLLQAVLLFGTDKPLSKKDIEEGKEPVKCLYLGTTTLFTKKTQSTEILNENLIPEKYKKAELKITGLSVHESKEIIRVIEEWKVNGSIDSDAKITKKESPVKDDIKSSIKNGESVEGAEIKTNYSIIIK